MKDRKRLEEIMSAIAFAEAGEHETARDLLRPPGSVLLAVSERMVDPKAFSYATGICKRIGADMAVLFLAQAGREHPDLQRLTADVGREGVRCRVVRKEGCMKKAILEYTEKHREVLFVVVGSAPELEIECATGEQRTLTDAWRRLKCPLVVVSPGESPSAA